MALSNKSSVLAVMAESTEGTPVIPAGTTSYTAMQSDFSMDPAFEVLANNELRSSIGQAQPILGLERPQMTFSHYIRHSGTEGTAPDFSLLLKAAFGGITTEGTQRVLTAASSVSLLKGAAGVGSHFERGQGMLIKDGTNGYSIRPVHSISTDDITPGFNLLNAPASGVGLGKAILYKPADSGHPSLSLWCYRANGGAVELMAGARVTSFTLNSEAGQLINGQFQFSGTGYYYNPINITTSTKYIDFYDGTLTMAFAATVKTYKDPHELASALTTGMNAQGSAATYTVTYSNSTGKFTFASTGGTFTIKWNTGTNTANSIASKVGYSTAADSSGATSYATGSALSFASPYTPALDSAAPLAAKDNEVLIGDATDTGSLSTSKISFSLTDDRFEVKDVTAESGVSGSVITGRKANVKLTSLVTQYDADKFKRMRLGTTTRFLYNFGTKSGGNWVAGSCACLYIPTAIVQSIKLSDDNGLLTLELELQAYVDSSGNGECYLSFL